MARQRRRHVGRRIQVIEFEHDRENVSARMQSDPVAQKFFAVLQNAKSDTKAKTKQAIGKR